MSRDGPGAQGGAAAAKMGRGAPSHCCLASYKKKTGLSCREFCNMCLAADPPFSSPEPRGIVRINLSEIMAVCRKDFRHRTLLRFTTKYKKAYRYSIQKNNE